MKKASNEQSANVSTLLETGKTPEVVKSTISKNVDMKGEMKKVAATKPTTKQSSNVSIPLETNKLVTGDVKTNISKGETKKVEATKPTIKPIAKTIDKEEHKRQQFISYYDQKIQKTKEKIGSINIEIEATKNNIETHNILSEKKIVGFVDYENERKKKIFQHVNIDSNMESVQQKLHKIDNDIPERVKVLTDTQEKFEMTRLRYLDYYDKSKDKLEKNIKMYQQKISDYDNLNKLNAI